MAPAAIRPVVPFSQLLRAFVTPCFARLRAFVKGVQPPPHLGDVPDVKNGYIIDFAAGNKNSPWFERKQRTPRYCHAAITLKLQLTYFLLPFRRSRNIIQLNRQPPGAHSFCTARGLEL